MFTKVYSGKHEGSALMLGQTRKERTTKMHGANTWLVTSPPGETNQSLGAFDMTSLHAALQPAAGG